MWVNVHLEKCLNSVINVKAVVATFNQEKALVGAFSVITNLRIVFVSSSTKVGPGSWRQEAAGVSSRYGGGLTSSILNGSLSAALANSLPLFRRT